MSDFLAMLYNKDGLTREKLTKDEYDELKATGEWFDSQKEAMEKQINDKNNELKAVDAADKAATDKKATKKAGE